MKRWARLGWLSLLGTLALAPAACTTRHGDYTVLSNKLVRTADLELSQAKRQRDVVGEDVLHYILFIPTKSQVTLEQAVDNALRKGRGDLLTDVTVEFWSWHAILYGQMGWRVKGDVVRTRE